MKGGPSDHVAMWEPASEKYDDANVWRRLEAVAIENTYLCGGCDVSCMAV